MTGTRRSFLKSALITSAAATQAACNNDSEEITLKRPNIILLLADDQRNDTLGCTGHKFIKTPNIDNLAESGVLFENAFVTTPICAASRASIFCGLHERVHKYTFKKSPLETKYANQSYSKILKDSGYHTGFIGKFGISVQKNFISENFDYYKKINRSPYFHKLPDGNTVHETDAAIYYAKEFISQSSDSQLPFTLSISFNAPHAAESRKVDTPFPPPESTRGMYDHEQIPPPKFSDRDNFSKLPIFLRKSMNRIRFYWRWNKKNNEFQRNMRDYLSMISGIDNAIGNLISHLEQNKLLDNTVIIYSADNGFYMGDRGFAGKWSHFEESLRVPLIIRNPYIDKSSKGDKVKALALNIDLCATILDFAGVGHLYSGKSGMSLKKWSEGKNNPDRRKFFLCEHLMDHESIPKWEGVRSQSYTYARYFQQQPSYEFLYDLESDPNQLNNLAKKDQYASLLFTARKKCDELIEQQNI